MWPWWESTRVFSVDTQLSCYSGRCKFSWAFFTKTFIECQSPSVTTFPSSDLIWSYHHRFGSDTEPILISFFGGYLGKGYIARRSEFICFILSDFNKSNPRNDYSFSWENSIKICYKFEKKKWNRILWRIVHFGLFNFLQVFGRETQWFENRGWRWNFRFERARSVIDIQVQLHREETLGKFFVVLFCEAQRLVVLIINNYYNAPLTRIRVRQ